MAESNLELLGLLANSDVYKERLLTLEKTTKEANAAKAAAEKATAESKEFIRIADEMKSKHAGELAAKQRAHDDAAGEAAARIKVQNDQAATLLELQQQLDRRAEDLAARERRSAKAYSEITRKGAELAARELTIEREEAKLAKKRELAKQFLAA